MRRPAGIVLAFAAAAILLNPLPASAASSTISFATPETTAAFGEAWYVEIQVAAIPDPERPLEITAGGGTVDVLVSGIAGTFATLPVQNGGLAFFSQPLDKPLLPAGSYTLTAIFNPAADSDFTGSSSSGASLIITPLEVTTQVTASADPSEVAEPVITAALSGEYTEATGQVPAGVWTFRVTEAGEDTLVFENRQVQEPFAEEPITVVVDARLSPATEYEVAWTFEPVEEIAAGLTITTEGTASFTTAAGTILETLANPVVLPVWAWIAIVVALMGLVAAVVVLLVRSRKRGNDVPDVESPDETSVEPELGDPADASPTLELSSAPGDPNADR